MRYTTATKQTLAILLAVVMATSVLAMGFIGGAAADVQTIEDLTVDEDVSLDQDSVEHTITLHNVQSDQSGDEIIISSDDLTNDNLVSVSGTDFDDGTFGGSASIVDDGGEDVIEVDLEDSNDGDTGDIEITVELNTESDLNVDQEVTYEANSVANDGQASGIFTILEPKPEIIDAVVNADAPFEIEVTFDEPVDTTGAGTGDFDFDSEGLANDPIAVNDVESVQDSTTVVLTLDGAIESNDADPIDESLDVTATNIVHANDNTVAVDDGAAANNNVDVTNNAQPTPTGVEVPDDEPAGTIIVTFSEDVQTDAESAIDDELSAAFEFTEGTIDGLNAEGTDAITLDLEGTIDPGADFSQALTYTGADGNDPIISDTGSTAVAVDFTEDVENNVAPRLESAEITADNPNEIKATFDGVIQDGSGDVSAAFDLGTADAAVIGTDVVRFEDGQTTAVLQLDTTLTSQDSDYTDADGLDYTAGQDAIESASGTPAADNERKDVTHNVQPLIEQVQITDANPDQIRVTFSEDIDDDADENLDTAVSDALEIDENDANQPLNVNSYDSVEGGDTIVANLATEGGTPQEPDFENKDEYELTTTFGAELDDDEFTASGTDVLPRDVTDEPIQVGQIPTIDDVTAFEDTSSSVSEELIEITFTEEIDRVGTKTQTEDAFNIQDAGLEIGEFRYVAGDTVRFTIVNAGEDPTSDSDFSGGVDYNPTAPSTNNPLVDATFGNGLDDPDGVAVTNDIQPYITAANVQNDDEIGVTFSEDVEEDGSPTDADYAAAFDFTDSQADVDGVASTPSGTTLVLSLDSDVTPQTLVDALTYTEEQGDDPIKSTAPNAELPAATSSAVPNNGVEVNPELQRAYVDNLYDTVDDGEVILEFDTAVQADPGTDVSGLELEIEDREDIDLEIQGSSLSETGPSNIVTFEVSETSDRSDLEEGDDDLEDVLSVDDLNNVDITAATGTPAINGDIVEFEDVTIENEIASGVDEVDDLTLERNGVGEANVLATEDDIGTVELEVTGFSGNFYPAGESVTVDISDDHSEKVTVPRFGDHPEISNADTSTFDPATEIRTSAVTVGDEVTVSTTDATVTGSADEFTLVHEAATPVNTGYSLVSQPSPGDLVIGDDEDGINNVEQFYADPGDEEDEFQNYFDADEVGQVHRALFLHAVDVDAEYGFVFDEDRSDAQTDYGSVDMGEGWHVLGSNYEIGPSGLTDLDLQTDLNLANEPDDNVVNVFDTSLSGSTLTNTHTVDQYEAYYVYLQEEDDRPIVLPEYDGSP